MAVRYCIGCNKRHPQNTMIPLSLDAGGSCVVGRGRRSAWVCERASCVKAVTDGPGPASRSFRARVRPHEDLKAQVEHWRAVRQKNALLKAHRSGLLVFSADNHSDRPLDETVWFATADHLTDHPNPQINSSNKRLYSSIMAVESEAIAQITGRPACTLLGIRSGRATQSLIDSLRRWHHVG